MGNWAPAATGLVVGVAFLVLLDLALSPGKSISTVIIPEGSSLANAECYKFERAIIKVVIGINNTVQWVNPDLTLHSVRADDEDDPDFHRATQDIF